MTKEKATEIAQTMGYSLGLAHMYIGLRADGSWFPFQGQPTLVEWEEVLIREGSSPGNPAVHGRFQAAAAARP